MQCLLTVRINDPFAKTVVFVLLLPTLLFVSSCKKDDRSFTLRQGNDLLEVSLQKMNDSLYHINLAVNGKRHDQWPLEYPVYRFDYGEIRENGQTDIAVGVIKPTRFFTNSDKRLFLFKITDDYYVRPLWLGSRVAQPLEDFRLTSKTGKSLVRTLEKEKSGRYLVANYRWQGFGLAFDGYVKREISLSEAQKLLDK